jgi:hypothetical protein
MAREYFVCHSCGERVECSGEEQPCDVLTGWLIVCQWKGLGAVDHYDFCSLSCLKAWADSQVPEVPNVFLKAFKKGSD